MTRFVVLHGPAGSGKSLHAKAFADLCGCQKEILEDYSMLRLLREMRKLSALNAGRTLVVMGEHELECMTRKQRTEMEAMGTGFVDIRTARVLLTARNPKWEAGIDLMIKEHQGRMMRRWRGACSAT